MGMVRALYGLYISIIWALYGHSKCFIWALSAYFYQSILRTYKKNVLHGGVHDGCVSNFEVHVNLCNSENSETMNILRKSVWKSWIDPNHPESNRIILGPPKRWWRTRGFKDFRIHKAIAKTWKLWLTMFYCESYCFFI